MGIYVKGETKPNVCEECWFHVHWNKFEDLQCGLMDGKTIALNTWQYEGQTSVPEWCPLIEVRKPHGRLVDIGDVKKAIFDYHGEDEQKVRTMINAILSSVSTVIEGED